MVFRIFWNVSAGLLHRAVSKNTIKKGMAINYPAVWRARPGFLDCDVNMHLNNASYLFNMELARWHFSAVTGIFFEAMKKRQKFLLGSQTIRYRHPIPPFRPYEIRTRIVYSDDNWIYFSHQFQCPTTGKLYAEGLVRLQAQQGNAKTVGNELIRAVGDDVLLPETMPPVVEEFLKWEGSSIVKLETTEEKDRRIKETVASLAPRSKGLWGRITRTWNLPF